MLRAEEKRKGNYVEKLHVFSLCGVVVITAQVDNLGLCVQEEEEFIPDR
jgi:hypothetical protein